MFSRLSEKESTGLPLASFQMRLRVQTLPPLPDLKAWFIPDAHRIPSSIRELKEILCSDIVVLKGARIALADIQLLLDDFELLNESPFSAALRDGDLLCIRAASSLPTLLKVEEKVVQGVLPQRKRKRIDEKVKVHKKHRKVTTSESGDENDLSSSSSSSSSSSASTSSSSSSSNFSSKCSEESDSSSSSSPSSPQPSIPFKRARAFQRITTSPSPLSQQKSSPQGPFVPPGRGKPTTHARNLRRKRLRAAQAEHRTASRLQEINVVTPPSHLISPSNALPLGEKASSRTTLSSTRSSGKEKEMMMDLDKGAGVEMETEERQEVMMASLGNKNKKKGYKHSLMAPVPRKIVFAEDGVALVPPSMSASATASAPPVTAQASTPQSTTPTSLLARDSSASLQLTQPLPRLIPPSEIQERGNLPPNVFVTSVDVEADLRNVNDKKKSRTNGVNSPYGYNESYKEESESNMMLSYGDPESGGITGAATDPAHASSQGTVSSTLDWDQAEQLFENGHKVSCLDDLKSAQIVGWKSLDLNPQTFTPEILLIAAKVLESSDSSLSVKVQRLARPVDPDSAFSAFLVPGDRDTEGTEAEGEVEEYQWTDILTSDWRIMQCS